MLSSDEETKRKGVYFTESLLLSIVKMMLREAEDEDVIALFFIKIYLGTELMQLLDEIRETLDWMREYPKIRRKKAFNHAIFYGVTDLETLKSILSNNLEDLALDENTDIYGNLFTID